MPDQATGGNNVGRGDGERRIVSASDAAAVASRDAAAVARSAADATMTAHEAATQAGVVASSASQATAMIVASAAAAAAEIATRAAAAMRTEAASRALEVAGSAELALEIIKAELPVDVDLAGAKRIAALVAATVAADVITQAKLTERAAATVATAVTLAADAAALAAAAAATIVNVATDSAAASGNIVVGSSAATKAASDVAVESTARVADTALRRVAQLRRVPLEAELRDALARNELRLHYQPMLSMDSGAVVAVEALLRWQHPTRGLLPPSQFLDVAEGPHLVIPIGHWVLQTAVAQAADWQRSLGDSAPHVWVNISCDQLGGQQLPSTVERLTTAAGLNPHKLGLEVTERQLARRADDVASDLNSLREIGIGLAVDDFGTGYASLDYLRMCPFDEIKIDQSFVAGLDRDRTDTAVITSIIALGTALDLAVVAEGVETPEQHRRLKDMGCTISQGYLHHRPARAEALVTLLDGR